MPLENRVNPFSEIVAVPTRGLFMGNRGVLHGPNRKLSRRVWTTRTWISCLLSFKGRHRTVMTPGRYTELFFLDEATALAAGHRPCGECRRPDYLRFKEAWVAANSPGMSASKVAVAEMDRVLHADRVSERRGQRRFMAPFGELPDGTMVTVDGSEDAWLLAGGAAWRWKWDGYCDPQRFDERREVTVLTPRSIVGALAAGYCPVLHPSAARA